MHYIEKCQHCGTVVSQCRCASLHKEIRFCTCFNCTEKLPQSIIEKSEPETTTNVMTDFSEFRKPESIRKMLVEFMALQGHSPSVIKDIQFFFDHTY